MPNLNFPKSLTTLAKSVAKIVFILYLIPLKLYRYRVFCRKVGRGELDPCFNTVISKDNLPAELLSLLDYYPSESLYSRVSLQNKKRYACASVVFNSSLSLEHGIGIDKSDIVIRVNFMPTHGFEKYVGSKTTIRVLGRSWLFKEGDEILVHSYTNSKYVDDDLSSLRQSHDLRSRGIYASNDKLIQMVYYDWLQGLMTNGFRAVLIALELADHVTIYGCDKLNSHWWYPFYKKIARLKPNHFPSASHMPYIQKLQTLTDLEVDYSSYFKPFSDNTYSLHSTIAMEYAFYMSNSRITMKV